MGGPPYKAGKRPASGKRALLTGCCYPGTKAELNGCVNDVFAIKEMLMTHFGFQESDIEVMADTDKTTLQPNGANIRAKLNEMCEQAQPGDSLVWHFSGHGTQVPCAVSKEKDGKEEAIVPADMNVIIDDDLRLAVNKMPLGAKFTFMADCCHSGGLLDHEQVAITGPKVGGPPPPSPAEVAAVQSMLAGAGAVSGAAAATATATATAAASGGSAGAGSKPKSLPIDDICAILTEQSGTVVSPLAFHQGLVSIFGVLANGKSKISLGDSLDMTISSWQTTVRRLPPLLSCFTTNPWTNLSLLPSCRISSPCSAATRASRH